ncbi:MAG TPA: hypothetical protein ENK85_05440 [Saprospiraceae bacterium]|nr:hypothetical protein [Saprospiraceae bacterium]
MKPFIFILFFWALSIPLLQAQCSGYINLLSQSDVDSFPINHPGCTDFDGSIVIGSTSPNDIQNLNGLSQLETISGAFYVENTQLVDFSELTNLQLIDGPMAIRTNNLLTSFNGLQNVESVLKLWVSNCSQIINFQGLNGLKKIGSNLTINNNSLLKNLDGLSGVDTVGYKIHIYDNPKLENLNAFSSIQGLYQIYLTNNTSLNDISGLSDIGLEYI